MNFLILNPSLFIIHFFKKANKLSNGTHNLNIHILLKTFVLRLRIELSF